MVPLDGRAINVSKIDEVVVNRLYSLDDACFPETGNSVTHRPIFCQSVERDSDERYSQEVRIFLAMDTMQ